MSDFLDRLVARAIGSEALLKPRLPALFEPRAGTVPMLFTAGTEGRPEPPRDAAVLASSPSPHEPAWTHAALPEYVAARGEPVSVPPITAAKPRRTTAKPGQISTAPRHTRSRRGVDETLPEAVKSAPGIETTMARATVPPRHARTIVEAGPPPRAATGALLPAAAVFATQRATEPAPNPPAATAAPRARFAVADTHATSEPVVHVSIGRLEVRAAPPAVVAPRRRDEPRPSSIDDYLRQRGKVSP
jgi:hypothetical protein